MRRLMIVAGSVLAVAAGSVGVYSQGRGAPAAVVYEGARLIIGDTSPVIENGAFVVETGRITAIGAKGAVKVPAGAMHVDLTGKTVMPSLVDAHAHFGYEHFLKAEGEALPENFTEENLLDHMQREAFYGVGTVNDGGSAAPPIALKFRADQEARSFPPAAQFWFNAGIVPPEGGPDDVLIKGTRPLHANYEVIRAPEARAAVDDIAAKNITHLKIWMGDRGGSYPAMPREVYEAVIDEAHKKNIRVHVHATNQRDEKDALRTGADLLVHIIGNAKLDDELVAIIKEKKPYWAPIIGSGDRSEVCDNDTFTTQVLPQKLVAEIIATRCRPNANAAMRDEMLKANLTTMINSGARIVLGTDAGIRPAYAFGSAEHHELTAYNRLGMTPAQVIIAATSTSAEAIGLKNVGTLAAGKDADFLVLNANPLDNIRNTRDIASVYLHGAKLNREAMLAAWKKADTSQ